MLARSTLAQALPVALALGSCLSPPAVMPAVRPEAELARELYPAGAQPVELEQGARLAGLWVPAEPGAPVVLHLLEASGSPASLKYHYAVICRQLRDLGLASLIVDYRGVGASEGTRSARHLAEDARAMWAEAVARAGGDPARVVLRGVSLGTLAAGLLLEEGARPGLVILHAPVLADTAVERFARARHGAFVAWWAGLAYRDVAPVDLVRALAACPAPLLVIAGAEDFFLSSEERARLAEAVRAAGGAWRAPPRGHAGSTILAHALLGEEVELLAERFPPPPLDAAALEASLDELPRDVAARFADAAVRARLADLARLARHADPLLCAAVALADGPALDALRYLWLVEERGALRELPFDELVDALSLDDPAGRLPIDAIEEASLLGDLHERFGGGGMSESVGLSLLRVRAALAGEEATVMSYSVDIGWDAAEVTSDARELVDVLRAAGFPEEALPRAAMRVLLKAARIPERVRVLADGEVALEVLEEGAWRELDLDGEEGERAFTFSLPQELGRRARELVEREQARTPP